MNNTAIVFNIQRFSIHDGPGIRTTVFLKGCPLRCAWCSNPESQAARPQIMVRDIKCVGCGECVRVCPEGAVTLTPEQGRRIDWQRCAQCLKCAEACGYESILVSGREMKVEEILAEVVRDEVFYRRSGGGVTVSGGEPMMRHRFLRRFLPACREAGLHVALDTTGFAAERDYLEVLPHIDLLLFDIKTLDPERHLQATGVDNQVILANAETLAPRVRTWFRLPLIAGFNDSEEHIRAVADLAARLGVEKISLLPYHEGGRSKAAQVGMAYGFEAGAAPEEERIEALLKTIESAGLSAGRGS